MELVLGGISAVCAGVFTNPLEVIKIRMQLQGELQSKGQYTVHYRNVFHAAYTIVRKDGILALQKGLAPGLCYQFVMNGTRLGMYDIIDKSGFTRNSNGNVNPLKSMAVGAMSGVAGGCVGSPLFLVKTHLQAQANSASIAVGHQHQHRSMLPALRSIHTKYGVKGLFRGISSTLPRIMVASSVQLSTFEKSLEFVRSSSLVSPSNRWGSAFLASLVSGLFVATAMAPFDLMSTRFYNQGVDEKGRGLVYRSVLDCGRKIYREEGIFGFYKGWTANYFRLGPHTLLSLVFWDQLKHYHKGSKKDN